jgi:hypothetical protein
MNIGNLAAEASDPSITPARAQQIYDTRDPVVLEVLARNPNLPDAVMARLVIDAPAALAGNAALPYATLTGFQHYPETGEAIRSLLLLIRLHITSDHLRWPEFERVMGSAEKRKFIGRVLTTTLHHLDIDEEELLQGLDVPSLWEPSFFRLLTILDGKNVVLARAIRHLDEELELLDYDGARTSFNLLVGTLGTTNAGSGIEDLALFVRWIRKWNFSPDRRVFQDQGPLLGDCERLFKTLLGEA